ncbi:uncharacterized protein LOC143613376 [Bidens hawaiensis]|uniref:uncharacterized protein LOC143613376 n=1 Tax=Bidens hawaiensis TaxID=980011 RepID=UPI0040491D66
MCCVNFDEHEGEGNMGNEVLMEGEGNMGNMEEDEDYDNVHQEGDVEAGHTNSIKFYETQDPTWIDAAIEVADAIQDVSNEKDVANAIQNASNENEVRDCRQPDFTDDMPSFKLLSQYSHENVEKEVCESFQRLKRETKLSEYDKSPWLERAVNVMKGLTKEEKMVWNYVLEGAVYYGQLTKKGKAAQEKKEVTPVKRTMGIPAYETKFGFKCMHYSFSELTPSTPVGSTVIDAWATILNFEEAKRSSSSPYRLFGYIGLYVSKIK